MPCKIPKLAPEPEAYLKAILRDATGEASLRCWDVGEDPRKTEQSCPGFRNGLCANFWGHRNFNDALQIKCQIDQMEPVHVGPEELKNLLPSTTQSIDGMFQDVVECWPASSILERKHWRMRISRTPP